MDSFDKPQRPEYFVPPELHAIEAERAASHEHLASVVPATRSSVPRPAVAGGIVWLAATIAIIAAAWFLGPALVERYHQAATRGRVAAQYEHAMHALREQPLTNVSAAFELVAQKIRPSVVSIQVGRLERADPARRLVPVLTQGSGVIVSENGYIITNEHVVRDAREIAVMLFDRRIFTARVVGADQLTDLAVLKIDGGGLIPAEWGDSDETAVGSLVWAVGSPFSFDQTITSGILSAKERQGTSLFQEYLQTDAAVNPGNSGGPLVNAMGQVIGINTAIYGQTYQGISFAIPSSTVSYVYSQLVERGDVGRSYLGVQPTSVFQHDAENLELPDLNGAYVRMVVDDAPAARAGIQPGDVIRTWNGRPIAEHYELFRHLARTKPGSTISIELYRDGTLKDVEVQVVEMPPEVLQSVIQDSRLRRGMMPGVP